MDSRTTWALDSGFLSYLDSGFHCLDSGFQNSGFRIPKPTKVGFRITSQGANVMYFIGNTFSLYELFNVAIYSARRQLIKSVCIIVCLIVILKELWLI